jgi:hypothetical protein
MRYACIFAASIDETGMTASAHTIELYGNDKGETWQCDLTNSIGLQFGDWQVRFSARDFLTFCRHVNQFDIRALLFDLSDACDYQMVEAPKNALSHRLTLCELIQLRDLVNGTKFALELESMLHEVLGYEPVTA